MNKKKLWNLMISSVLFCNALSVPVMAVEQNPLAETAEGNNGTEAEHPGDSSASEGEEQNTEIRLNEACFPDPEFRNVLNRNFGFEEGALLSDEQLSSVERLFISFGQISSLQGIEYFPNLKTLACTDQKLTGLDLSKNRKLQVLSASNNPMTSLVLPKTETLRRITVNNNQLSELDLSGLSGLQSVDCKDNRIKALDLFSCSSLSDLDVSGNAFASLDLSGYPQISSAAFSGQRIDLDQAMDPLPYQSLDFALNPEKVTGVTSADRNETGFSNWSGFGSFSYKYDTGFAGGNSVMDVMVSAPKTTRTVRMPGAGNPDITFDWDLSRFFERIADLDQGKAIGSLLLSGAIEEGESELRRVETELNLLTESNTDTFVWYPSSAVELNGQTLTVPEHAFSMIENPHLTAPMVTAVIAGVQDDSQWKTLCHEGGFDAISDVVYNDLTDYLSQHGISNNYPDGAAKDGMAIYYSGHGLGGVIGDLLDQKMLENGWYMYGQAEKYFFGAPLSDQFPDLQPGFGRVMMGHSILNKEDMMASENPILIPLRLGLLNEDEKEAAMAEAKTASLTFRNTESNYITSPSLDAVYQSLYGEPISDDNRMNEMNSVRAYMALLLDESRGKPDLYCRSTSVFCPVDLYIYDQNGDPVATVINETVENKAPDRLKVYCQDEHKYVVSLSGEVFSYEIKAREAGTMGISLSDAKAGHPQQVVFSSIQLSPDKSFAMKSNDENNPADASVYVIDENKEPSASIDQNGQETGTKPAIEIKAQDVSGLEQSYPYTGQAVEPKPAVTVDGVQLVENTDYTLSYQNNVEPGTATLTVTGCNGYSGTVTVTFTITRAEEAADKTALEALISQVKDTDLNEYTDESAKTFRTALQSAQAVLGSDTADQTEVNAARTALEEAFNALTKKPAESPDPDTVDKSALEQAVNAWKGKDLSAYTDASAKVLQTALTEGQSVLDNADATQDAVNAAVSAITKAADALVKKAEPDKPAAKADKSMLQAKYNKYSIAGQTSYTAASWKPFAAEMAKAKAVLDNPDATQAEVDAELEALQKVYLELVPVKKNDQKTDPTKKPGANTGITGTIWIVVAAVAAIVILVLLYILKKRK